MNTKEKSMGQDDVKDATNIVGSSSGSSQNTGRSFFMAITIAEASAMFPGFRFSPSDEELLLFYLKKKLQGSNKNVEVIPEVDICKHEPWDLPAFAVIQSDYEWFFFSPRGRKYPNGCQSKRATECGYWKATGKERGVKCGPNLIGTKRTLVFHTGRAPKGQRTEWIMHEYSASDKSEDGIVVCRIRKNKEFHFDEDSNINQDAADREYVPERNKSTDSGSSSSPQEVETVPEPTDQKSPDANELSPQLDLPIQSFHHELSPQLDLPIQSLKGTVVEEDDCYADIMKDDIVTLDEKFPFQVTANRRLRLAINKPKPQPRKRQLPSGIAKMLEEQKAELKVEETEEQKAELKVEETDPIKSQKTEFTEFIYYIRYVIIIFIVLIFLVVIMFCK